MSAFTAVLRIISSHGLWTTIGFRACRPTPDSLGSQMWREAFQSIANDVERLSQDVDKEVADDPLASIGMGLKAAAPKEKDSEKSGGAGSLAAKRRQKEDQEKDAAAAAAAVDPFARRRTRPKSYWSVGNELDSSAEVGVRGSALGHVWLGYSACCNTCIGWCRVSCGCSSREGRDEFVSEFPAVCCARG